MDLRNYQRKDLMGFLRILATAVPWQHLYRQTLGKKHLTHPAANRSILSGKFPQFDPLTFSPSKMTIVSSPDQATWADPFIWAEEGKVCLFKEELPAGETCGYLSVVELDSSGLPKELPIPILKNNSHHSYPFIFKYADDLWMIPENSMANQLRLYRCIDFPHKWVPDKILMEGVRYADPTLFEHQGRWWLFMTLAVGFYGVNTNLFLFSSDSPLSDEWVPHPMNPIVSGFHQSRPAGRLFYSKGRLYRPSQDCFKRYGHALRINEITRLDAEHYEEKFIRKIEPWEDDILGVHHIEINGDLIMMDIHRISESTTA
ncbi:MAG: hypothetical protein V4640_02130 [Verrucomicrobiota bacterium]